MRRIRCSRGCAVRGSRHRARGRLVPATGATQSVHGAQWARVHAQRRWIGGRGTAARARRPAGRDLRLPAAGRLSDDHAGHRRPGVGAVHHRPQPNAYGLPDRSQRRTPARRPDGATRGDQGRPARRRLRLPGQLQPAGADRRNQPPTAHQPCQEWSAGPLDAQRRRVHRPVRCDSVRRQLGWPGPRLRRQRLVRGRQRCGRGGEGGRRRLHHAPAGRRTGGQ
jgi:hypothetical protein